MLGQRCKRWCNIEATLCLCPLFVRERLPKNVLIALTTASVVHADRRGQFVQIVKSVSSPAHSEHATPSKLCTYIYFGSVRQRRWNILDTTAKFVATHIIRPIYRHDTTDRQSVMACLWKFSPFFPTSLQHFAEHEFCLVKFGSTFEHSTWIMSYT